MKNQFKIGAAKAVITPPLGTLLYGYAFKRPAASVNDDLRVNAVAIEQGDVSAIMISADIVSIGVDLGDKIRALISKETKVPAENISFSATHTHSGPAIKTAKGWGSANETYINEILIPQTVAAAKEACKKLTPAVMGVGTCECKAGVNRRELAENGDILLGQNPFGVFDSTMTVVSFRTPEGDPLVNMVHYGAHGTAAGRNIEITRDWPGVMVDTMERETGAMTLFFNGAEGDAGPRISNGQTTGDTRDWTKTEEPTGDIRYVYEVGTIAGVDAVRAYKSIKEYSEVDFMTESGVLRLPYDPQWSYEDAKARLDELNAKDKLVEVENREHAKISGIVEMYEKKIPFDTHMEINQTIFAFNSVAFVPFHFEIFSEISLRMRAYSPFEHTLCMCNTNGSNFYLPTRDQMERGGYEIDIFRLGNVYKLVDETDNVIIQENLKLLRKLKPMERKFKERYM
ncbi:MAG: neutral/alkaline non-lysosomal ceramidase N-terminal domain-containing protein [Oscillospiraceae bacterium]|nr:neutral/alkaline non-lysosomal ceramidase N-terminal domain-containing protein [Oscillospiraceae bacterium]